MAESLSGPEKLKTMRIKPERNVEPSTIASDNDKSEFKAEIAAIKLNKLK